MTITNPLVVGAILGGAATVFGLCCMWIWAFQCSSTESLLRAGQGVVVAFLTVVACCVLAACLTGCNCTRSCEKVVVVTTLDDELLSPTPPYVFSFEETRR